MTLKKLNAIAVSNTITQHSSIIKSGATCDFKFRFKSKMHDKGFIYDHNYNFISFKGNKYQVNLHQYDIGIFAVKFNLYKHNKSKNKYSIITNTCDANVIIKTVITIMLHVLNNNPNCSFCFIGSPKDNETTNNTKRFRVYKNYMQRYFDTNNFDHVIDIEQSFYSLINKKVNVIELNLKLKQLFKKEVEITSNSFNNLTRNTK